MQSFSTSLTDVSGRRPVNPLRPKSHEVVIAVEAAGVNNADHAAPRRRRAQCLGDAPPRCASIGDDVTDWSVGDRVCALLAGGGYANEVAVAASQLPPGSASAGASVRLLRPRHDRRTPRRPTRPDPRRPLWAASAIQWAAIGVTVITTAGSENAIGKRAPSTAINYRTDDFVAATSAAAWNPMSMWSAPITSTAT